MNRNGFFNPLKLLFGRKDGKPAEKNEAAAQTGPTAPPRPAPAQAVARPELRKRLEEALSREPEFFGANEKILGPGFAARPPEEKHELVSQALEAKRAGIESLEQEHALHARAADVARAEGEHEDAQKIERTVAVLRELMEVERTREQALLEELDSLLKTHPRLASEGKPEAPAKGKAPAPAAEPATTPRSKLERMLSEHPKLGEDELQEAEDKVREAARTYEVRPEPLSAAERKRVVQELHTLPSGEEVAEKAENVAKVKISYVPQEESEELKGRDDEGIDFGELANLKAKKEEINAVFKDIEKQKIVTDFDKILTYLRGHKKAKIAEMAGALSIDKERIMDHLKTLEDSRLIEIVYPPIGAPIVVYKEPKKEVDA